MNHRYALDLVVLVADLDQQETIRSLLDKRSQSLGIRKVTPEIASNVSLDRCQDPTFSRLRAHLRMWFGF